MSRSIYVIVYNGSWNKIDSYLQWQKTPFTGYKLLNNHKSEKLDSILVLEKTDNKSAIAIMINDLPVSLEIGESKSSTTTYPEVLQDFIKDGFNQNNADWIEFNPQKLFKKLADKVDF